MHTVKLNIANDIYEKFMGIIEILPKGSIKIEEIDNTPYYPAISFEEAQEKVEKAIAYIPKNEGKESSAFFKELLS